MKSIVISVVVVVMMMNVLPALAEQFRLKLPTTVDIVENGEVVGAKKLKAGTLLELSSDETGAVKKDSVVLSAKAADKQLNSVMALKLFQNKRPKAGAMFRVKLTLADYYNYDFEGKKSLYWSVDMKAYRPDGQDYDSVYGYMKKSNPAAKKMMALLKDGNDHLAYCKLVPVTNPDDDSVIIETFTPLVEPE